MTDDDRDRERPARLLVVAPHPDDDVIGCGGSVAKHVAAGASASVVYLTSGDAGGRDTTREALGARREQEATAAAGVLGVDRLAFLRAPDGYLASHADDLLVRLVDLVRDVRPDLFYVPHAGDGHPDHVAAHRLALHAVSVAGGPWFPETTGAPAAVGTVLAYEVWTPIAAPGHLEDTTAWHDQQLAALAHHASQLQDVAYDQQLDGLHRFRGAALGRGRIAEAFEVLRLAGGVHQRSPLGEGRR